MYNFLKLFLGNVNMYNFLKLFKYLNIYNFLTRRSDLKALVLSLSVASCSCFSAIMSSSCWAYAVETRLKLA